MRKIIIILTFGLSFLSAQNKQSPQISQCWKVIEDSQHNLKYRTVYSPCNSILKEKKSRRLSRRIYFKSNGDFIFRVPGITDIPKSVTKKWKYNDSKNEIYILNEVNDTIRKFDAKFLNQRFLIPKKLIVIEN